MGVQGVKVPFLNRHLGRQAIFGRYRGLVYASRWVSVGVLAIIFVACLIYWALNRHQYGGEVVATF